MQPSSRAGARVWTTLVAVACAVAFLAFAHRALAQGLGSPDLCAWVKQVWINDVGPALITEVTSGYFGVVVSDTVHVQDRLWCDFDYEWALNEYWDPAVMSVWEYESTSGDVNNDPGWLEWSGSQSNRQWVQLDKYLRVEARGWVTAEISETVDLRYQGGSTQTSRQLPFYLQELVEGGDAPSSYNHSYSSMTTHITGTVASFPVVWDWDGTMAPPPSYGFCHYSSLVPSFLGITVTHELDADLTHDPDLATNIDPATNSADRDLSDDGVTFPSLLPHCGTATVNVVGENNLGSDLYLNAWADWNRDGDWDDTSVCECEISEWVIQGYTVNPDPAPFDLNIPISSCHPVLDPTEPLWARVTLSELDPLPGAPWIYGGQPDPASDACFWEGETEDYLVEPELLEGGDAPTSDSHSPYTMTTYAGSDVQANFPVVWDWNRTLGFSPPLYGFCHYSPGTTYLGSPPSFELDADVPPDQDLVTNIDPATNTPDRDLSDDGVTFPGGLPRCVTSTVSFLGHNGSGGTLYLNLWADWNRDGDWEEGTQCGCGDHEWAIQDYAINPGAIEESIDITPCHTCDPTEPLWIRVTLTEVPLAPLGEPWVYGGQPYPAPEGYFELGETEDFLFRQRVCYQPLVMKSY